MNAWAPRLFGGGFALFMLGILAAIFSDAAWINWVFAAGFVVMYAGLKGGERAMARDPIVRGLK
jgi:hypothetical protein